MQRYTIFFITVNALHVSGGFSAHHQELKNCTQPAWYVPGLLDASASGSSKQARHIPDVVCTVFELLMMGGETALKCRALTVIKNIVYRCILLVIRKKYILET